MPAVTGKIAAGIPKRLIAAVADVDHGDGVRAGVGGNDAAQLKGDERRLAEGFAASLFKVGGLRDVGVADHIVEILHAFAPLLGQLHHGGHHLVIAADLGFHLGLAVDQGDDGADAHQLAHDRGGGRDAAALLHLLEAVGPEDDLHLVHLGLKLADDMAELRAVLQLAGHLAQIPAEHHRVGVGVQQMDVQMVLRALLPQHPLRHDGVVVGGRTGAVDGDMDDIGVALVHILAVFLTELDGGDGSRGGDALGGAHLVVELLGGVLFTLHDVFVVQQDVEAHNVDAVFLGQLLRDVAGGIGLIVLLLMVVVAVAVFLLTGIPYNKYEYLEKEKLTLQYGVSGILEKAKETFAGTYRICITLGVVLCILGAVPLLVVSVFFGDNGYAVILATDALLIGVAIAVWLFAWSGIIWGGFQKLLQEGDYTVENKAVNRKYEHVTAIYWCVWTALYLAISLSTMRWDITWVVWPVAGVLYGALLAFLKIKNQKAEHE